MLAQTKNKKENSNKVRIESGNIAKGNREAQGIHSNNFK